MMICALRKNVRNQENREQRNRNASRIEVRKLTEIPPTLIRTNRSTPTHLRGLDWNSSGWIEGPRWTLTQRARKEIGGFSMLQPPGLWSALWCRGLKVAARPTINGLSLDFNSAGWDCFLFCTNSAKARALAPSPFQRFPKAQLGLPFPQSHRSRMAKVEARSARICVHRGFG
jgi:hypothetical protein